MLISNFSEQRKIGVRSITFSGIDKCIIHCNLAKLALDYELEQKIKQIDWLASINKKNANAPNKNKKIWFQKCILSL